MTEHKIKDGLSPLEQAFQLAEASDEMVVLVSAANKSRILVGGKPPAGATERQEVESIMTCDCTL